MTTFSITPTTMHLREESKTPEEEKEDDSANSSARYAEIVYHRNTPRSEPRRWVPNPLRVMPHPIKNKPLKETKINAIAQLAVGALFMASPLVVNTLIPFTLGSLLVMKGIYDVHNL